MGKPVNDDALDALFREARTFSTWLDQPVSDDTLRQRYDTLSSFAPPPPRNNASSLRSPRATSRRS